MKQLLMAIGLVTALGVTACASDYYDQGYGPGYYDRGDYRDNGYYRDRGDRDDYYRDRGDYESPDGGAR
ncbi:MAG: hypothetical protein ACYC8V_08070 [Caulobacteraceae bacterium]